MKEIDIAEIIHHFVENLKSYFEWTVDIIPKHPIVSSILLHLLLGYWIFHSLDAWLHETKTSYPAIDALKKPKTVREPLIGNYAILILLIIGVVYIIGAYSKGGNP